MPAISLLLLCLFSAAGLLEAFESRPELAPCARLETSAVKEGSALLKSPAFNNVYWVINDSGNSPHLFAFTRDGKPVKPEAVANAEYKGIRVSSAANVDWEAMTADNSGNLIIADSGNNRNRRKNLAVYIVPEPDPALVSISSPAKKVMFRYPDQEAFPPGKMNFDAEAVFWADGRLYLVTKHRSDTRAKLYRFTSLEGERVNALKLVSSFDAGAMVTDAAVSADGKKLALLTYDGAWLLERPKGSDNYFAGVKKKLIFGAGQCEGITFDGPGALLVSNEEKELFEIKTADFK
ncbi:MAG: hypothetical protein A2234_05710 [Elusimicrobia bacterium RIFOXYA2_FULL_58_8]|nr:MAG: hypothetical protein A2234_05710 [Elusimicrobia bacterium RIFOXYA2_FULL_58_8]